MAAAATLSLTLVAPLAVIADRAAPNDLLYSVDLFFERVGIGAGGLDERLDEVDTLKERGHNDEAGQHLRESFGSASQDEVRGRASEIESLTRDLKQGAPSKNSSPPGRAGDNANSRRGGDFGYSSGPEPRSGDTSEDNLGKDPGSDSGMPSDSREDNSNKGPDRSEESGNSAEAENGPGKKPGSK